MAKNSETAMDLLREAADVLDRAAAADDGGTVDPEGYSSLALRIRAYLSSSRSTTPLGMPRLTSTDTRLTDDMVRHVNGAQHSGHVRIVPG